MVLWYLRNYTFINAYYNVANLSMDAVIFWYITHNQHNLLKLFFNEAFSVYLLCLMK